MPLDLSHTELPGKIQENMIAYMKLFVGLPGITIYDAESFWTVTDEGAPGSSIYRADFAERPEEQIDALFEQISPYVDQMDWMVFPGDSPADLNKRLEARGMPGGAGGNWLWADLITLGAAPKVAQNFRIEQVRDDAAMAEWTRVSGDGFGADESIFYNAYARHGYGVDAFSLHYIGYVDDAPVTSGTLLDAGGTASSFDISTPPDLRGQGFGGAITYFLMDEIRRRGYTDTWIWASNMAKSLYQSLGYVDADFGMREHRWRKGM
ncbi:MAG: GNAT family N-acetyltransferase [Chloroflexota bacterium]